MSAASEGDDTGARSVPPTPAAAVSSGMPNEDTTENVTESTRRRPFNTNRRPGGTSNTFKGKTSKHNRNVFQVHSERTNMSQFMETLEALRVYSSYVYKSNIESLTVLFTSLQTPTVSAPEDPVQTTDIVDRKEVKSVSKSEEMKYAENVKQFPHQARNWPANSMVDNTCYVYSQGAILDHVTKFGKISG